MARCPAASRSGFARALLACAAALLLALALPQNPAGATGAPEIWFSPKAGRGPVPGIADFSTFFRADNPAWTSVAAKIQVYSISFDHMFVAPDDEIERIASDLHSRHVKLAIVLGAVARLPGETCGVGEGYSRPQAHQKFVDRLASLKIQPDIVGLDSPLWFGGYDPKKCQLPVPALLEHLTPTIAIWAHAFPSATIGDIEPWIIVMQHPQWQADYRALKDGIAAATGVKLAFAHSDIGGNRPNWAAELTAVPPFVHSLGMRYGMIYDGRGRDATDEAWIASAKEKIAAMEDEQHVIPDDVIIASWNHHPERALPSTDPNTLSSLIDFYLARRH